MATLETIREKLEGFEKHFSPEFDICGLFLTINDVKHIASELRLDICDEIASDIITSLNKDDSFLLEFSKQFIEKHLNEHLSEEGLVTIDPLVLA